MGMGGTYREVVWPERIVNTELFDKAWYSGECLVSTLLIEQGAGTTMTVTLAGTLANTAGTTPGMQIPFNITALTGITDVAGNPPNVLGSSDRLVDYE